MKKIIFILVASLLLIQNSNSEENTRCADVRDNHKEYTKNLAKFKFNLCPNGNGVDTHRIWESFMVNTIPIVKNQTFVRNLIKNNVPLLVVEEWDELIDIGKDELDNIYIDLMEKRNNLNVNDVDFWIKNII